MPQTNYVVTEYRYRDGSKISRKDTRYGETFYTVDYNQVAVRPENLLRDVVGINVYVPGDIAAVSVLGCDSYATAENKWVLDVIEDTRHDASEVIQNFDGGPAVKVTVTNAHRMLTHCVAWQIA